MNEKSLSDKAVEVVIAGIIIYVVVVYIAPKVLSFGAGMAAAIYTRYGKCYVATVTDIDGNVTEYKVTRKEALELGLLEE